MQNCPRQLAMQSCVLCSFVRCGTSKQIRKKKEKKKSAIEIEETLNREGELLFIWFQEHDLILNLKPGKTDVDIYGTVRKLKSQSPVSINILCSNLNHEDRYEYLGVTLSLLWNIQILTF